MYLTLCCNIPGVNLQWSAGCNCSCPAYGTVSAHCKLDRSSWIQKSPSLPLEGSAQWHRGSRLCSTSGRVLSGSDINYNSLILFKSVQCRNAMLYYVSLITQVIIRGGGHILPYDQPARSFDMIDRFLSTRGWVWTVKVVSMSGHLFVLAFYQRWHL